MRRPSAIRPYRTPIEHLADEAELLRLRVKLSQLPENSDAARGEIEDSVLNVAHEIGARLRLGPPLPLSRLDRHCDLPETLYLAVAAAAAIVLIDPTLVSVLDWRAGSGVRLGSICDLVGDTPGRDELAGILSSGPLVEDGLISVRWTLDAPDDPFDARLRLTALGILSVIGATKYEVDVRDVTDGETSAVLNVIAGFWRTAIVERGEP